MEAIGKRKEDGRTGEPYEGGRAGCHNSLCLRSLKMMGHCGYMKAVLREEKFCEITGRQNIGYIR